MSVLSDDGRSEHINHQRPDWAGSKQGQHEVPDGVVASTVLLQGRREIAILHSGALYRLRVTASGKLILTK